jgi:hypothetical protein
MQRPFETERQRPPNRRASEIFDLLAGKGAAP